MIGFDNPGLASPPQFFHWDDKFQLACQDIDLDLVAVLNIGNRAVVPCLRTDVADAWTPCVGLFVTPSSSGTSPPLILVLSEISLNISLLSLAYFLWYQKYQIGRIFKND